MYVYWAARGGAFNFEFLRRSRVLAVSTAFLM